MTVFGVCVCCSAVFSFDPKYVPSVSLEGVKQPICRECIDDLNLRRNLQGVDQVVVHPLAYEDGPEDDNFLSDAWAHFNRER